MYSLLLLLIEYFIFLQFKITLLLFASKVFEPRLNLLGHVSEEIGLCCNVIEFSQLFLRYAKFLKQSNNLKFEFEKDFLVFNFEQILQPFHFAICEFSKILHLRLKLICS